jgi:hypothetical protein
MAHFACVLHCCRSISVPVMSCQSPNALPGSTGCQPSPLSNCVFGTLQLCLSAQRLGRSNTAVLPKTLHTESIHRFGNLPSHAATDSHSIGSNVFRFSTFNTSQFADAEELLLAHQHWQALTLRTTLQAAAAGAPFLPPRALLYTQVNAGWGNRLSSVVTGEGCPCNCGRMGSPHV